MKKTILLSSIAIILNSNVMANEPITFQNATSHYQKGNYKKSLAEYSYLAKKGDINAQQILTMLYSHGDFFGLGLDFSDISKQVPYNPKLALKWLKLSAKQGNGISQYELGRAYSKGLLGLQKNEKTALTWYTKAKNQGHPRALYNIGNMYRQGRAGLKINYKQAIIHYKKADEAMQNFRNQHHANALYNIGYLYLQGGYGIQRDVKKAYKYFSKAYINGQLKGYNYMMAICKQNPYMKECK